MLVKIIVVGKLKDRAFQARCDEFAKWISPYAKLEIRELTETAAITITRNSQEAEAGGRGQD